MEKKDLEDNFLLPGELGGYDKKEKNIDRKIQIWILVVAILSFIAGICYFVFDKLI